MPMSLMKMLNTLPITWSTRRTVTCRGLRFNLSYNNWILRYRARTYATKEPETLDWIDRFKADDVFLDVGANIGLYSMYAKRRHAGVHVVAIEPEYSNLHLLRDNIIKNELDIDTYSIALSYRNGLTHLNIQSDIPGAALHTEAMIKIEKTLAGKPVIADEGTYAMTLDQFCADLGMVPDCIKIDVDGTEDKILMGAHETLVNPQLRTILLEMPRPYGGPLIDAGFKLEWKGEENQIWSR